MEGTRATYCFGFGRKTFIPHAVRKSFARSPIRPRLGIAKLRVSATLGLPVTDHRPNCVGQNVKVRGLLLTGCDYSKRRSLGRHFAISQYNDLVTIDKFDVRDRIGELKTPLTLVRGVDDPGNPAEYELEIHQAVPGSKYIKLDNAGHFPMAERPDDINRAIEELMAKL